MNKYANKADDRTQQGSYNSSLVIDFASCTSSWILPPLPELENFKLFISFWKIVQIFLEIFVKCRAIKGLLFHVGDSLLICVTAIDVIRDQMTSCYVEMLFLLHSLIPRPSLLAHSTWREISFRTKSSILAPALPPLLSLLAGRGPLHEDLCKSSRKVRAGGEHLGTRRTFAFSTSISCRTPEGRVGGAGW